MSIYLVPSVVISLVASYLIAGLFWGRGSLPDCLIIKNWTVGTGILFVFCEAVFGFIIYLQASGQMPVFVGF